MEIASKAAERGRRPKPGWPAGSAKYRQGKRHRLRLVRNAPRSDRFCEFARGRESYAVWTRTTRLEGVSRRQNFPDHAGDGGLRAAAPAPQSVLPPYFNAPISNRPSRLASRYLKGAHWPSKMSKGAGAPRPDLPLVRGHHFSPLDRHDGRLANSIAVRIDRVFAGQWRLSVLELPPTIADCRASG